MNLFKNEIFVSVVSALTVALIIWLLRMLRKLFSSIFRYDYRQKRNELCSQSMYFRFFYKYFKKQKVKFHYYSYSTSDTPKLQSKKSCVVIGEGGVGKSSYLINDFIKFSPVFYSKVFFNSQEIISFNPAESEYKDKKFTNTILYLDGLDEVAGVDEQETKQRISQISKLISFFRSKSKMFVVKISCRKNFYNKYIRALLDEQRIDAVTVKVEKHKGDFMSFLLKNLKRDLKPQYSKELNKMCFSEDCFNSDMPIFNIFYVYKKLILKLGDDKVTDLYNYYDSFIKYYYLRSSYSQHASPHDIDELAKIVFNHYRDGKIISVKDLEKFKNLGDFVYKNNNGSATFIHHSFFEYFLAKYVINLFSNTQSINYNELFSYFNKESNNDLSDIIRDGINNMDVGVRQEICANLFNCYEVTLSDKLKAQLNKQHSEIYSIINTHAGCPSDTFDKNQFSNYHELIVKKEICLRFSRITGLPHKFLKAQLDFLKFIYYNDDVVVNEHVMKDIVNAEDYFKAILQRWSAIGASWLGNELGGDEIEVDYIEKMLLNSGDSNPYDFANRSNTLLYYGDVKSGDIFTFVDINKYTDWNIAGEKRLGRLKHQVNLNILNVVPVTKEEKTALKDYRFRAFDLATIYTFLLSRKDVTQDFDEKYENYYRVIKDLKLQYNIPENADEDRKKLIARRINLMLDIQQRVVALFSK